MVEKGTSEGVISDNLVSKEIDLRGKTAIVTGGSRDIGAAIVDALTSEGVNVVFSFHDKEKRANKVLAAVDGNIGFAKAIQADISTIGGREKFFQDAIGELGGEVDFLVLSTSGPTAALNEEASMGLLDLAIPHLNKGGSVIRLQSIPAKFDAQLRGLNLMEAVPEYYNVAAHKYRDMQSLRERQAELAEHGINLMEIAPPFVKGTSNVTLFEMAARRRTDGKQTAEDMHGVLTDKLGLPNVVSAEQVGIKIAQLLKDPELSNGHTEFFGENVQDTQTALERWYGVNQVYVQTLERLEEKDGKKYGIGRALVSKAQAERVSEARINPVWFIDYDMSDTGVLVVEPGHAEGHFKPESGYPQILPGHKQIRAAVETIGLIEGEFYNISGFEQAQFEGIVLADGKTKLFIKPQKNEDGSYNVEILRDTGERTAAIVGLRLESVSLHSDESKMREDQILEGSAQTMGALQAAGIEGFMPLFTEIGKTEFFDKKPVGGDGISYSAETEKIDKRTLGGTVIVESEGEQVARVSGLKAVMVKKAVVDGMIARMKSSKSE